jgi:hypothetical protein
MIYSRQERAHGVIRLNNYKMEVRIMEEKILLGGTWLFMILGMITLNSFALVLSMVASVTVIIRNRNEVITMITTNLEKFNKWLNNKKQ